MPTIPTPFIGGADPPQRDTGARREFAPPYHPGSLEPEDTSEPAVEHEPAEEPWERPGADEVQATVESLPMPSEAVEWALEPEEPEGEEPLQAEVEIAEPQEAEPTQAGVAEAKTLGRGWAALAEPASAEAALEEVGFEPIDDGSRQTELLEADTDEEEGELYEFPSFLFGADGTGVGESAAAEGEFEPPVVEEVPVAAPEPAARYETAERLAEIARELMASDERPRIEALIDDLRRLTADIAVPRAFAAGYLAAERRQEKK